MFVIALPWVPLAFLLPARYRDGLSQRFAYYPDSIRRWMASSRPIWIHAASVGEVRSAEALVRELKVLAPARRVLVSTFTATGHRVARAIPGVDAAIYLPLDFAWIVRRVFRIARPQQAHGSLVECLDRCLHLLLEILLVRHARLRRLCLAP